MGGNKSSGLNVPNIITSFRIAGSAVLLFIEPFTALFYILYTICGFSDVLDGFIARRTGQTSTLGAKLDSIADLLFYAIMLLRVLPALIELLPVWFWYCVIAIIAVRLAAYIVAAVKFKCFASLHTYMNKLTGGAIFCVPYILLANWPLSVILCCVIAVIAALSSAEELVMHLASSKYHDGVKSINEAIRAEKAAR